MKIEDVMERIIIYLYEAIHELLLLTEEERFEDAAKLRDDIEWKIFKTADYLYTNQLTPLSVDELIETLNQIKVGFIKEITLSLDIPREHHIFNI